MILSSRIYEKAGLSGIAELLAFFIKDLKCDNGCGIEVERFYCHVDIEYSCFGTETAGLIAPQSMHLNDLSSMAVYLETFCRQQRFSLSYLKS